MAENQKKLKRNNSVGKASSRTMRTASLDTMPVKFAAPLTAEDILDGIRLYRKL